MSTSNLVLNFNPKESKRKPSSEWVLAKRKDIKGNPNGKYLFVVVTVDKDDTEDTITELWKANSENQLYDLVKKEYVGEDEELSDQFDEDWCFSILYTKIGKIV